VTRREGAIVTLWRVPHTPAIAPQRVALPIEGTVAIGATDPRDDGAVVSLGGWAYATKPFVVAAAPGRVQPLQLATSGKYDAPTDIEAREVLVTSHDGVKVPVSVLSKKGVRLDGRNPTLIYGYGAYGSTEDPFFNTRFYAWIERGGVIAIAHVRGGGEYGDAWHEAGKKATKPNTWKDTIATAEWLIANGYTTRDRLGVYGGSAGGILVGRAITERPELFAAAIPAVGTADMIRAETSANGPANIPEFGTVTKPDEFAALLAMSSYHQVKNGTRYPGVMLVHGVNDIRVDVWESLKFGARLGAATTSARPVLLRLEYESGHGQGSTRLQLQERAADMWSFFLWQFGVPAFQPPA
jgi:prolyl oligopeptidase